MASPIISGTNDSCTIQLTHELYLAINEGLLFAHAMAESHEQNKASPRMAIIWYKMHEPRLTKALNMMGQKIYPS